MCIVNLNQPLKLPLTLKALLSVLEFEKLKYMTIDEILDEVEYYITDPAKWINYSEKRRSELRMMIEELNSQNSGNAIVSGSLPHVSEVEKWFAGEIEITDEYWQVAPFRTNGEVFDIVMEALIEFNSGNDR